MSVTPARIKKTKTALFVAALFFLGAVSVQSASSQPSQSEMIAALQALIGAGDAETMDLIQKNSGQVVYTPELAAELVERARAKGVISSTDAETDAMPQSQEKQPDKNKKRGKGKKSKEGTKAPPMEDLYAAVQALAAAGDQETIDLLTKTKGVLALTPQQARELQEKARSMGLLDGGIEEPADLSGILPPAKPMLWEVTGNGLETPSYLFGTIHVATPRIQKFHPEVQRAFDAADVVATETSMDASELIGAQSLLVQPGSGLSERLDGETYQKLDDVMKNISPMLSASVFESFKTWVVGYQLMQLPAQMKGMKVLDQLIWNRAVRAGKTTCGVDSIENQYTAFDVLDEKEQIIFLNSTLNHWDKIQGTLEELVRHYENGDKEAIRQIMEEDVVMMGGETEEEKAVSEKLEKTLVDVRDQRMTATIDRMLHAEPGKTHFFALGTAHFLGDEGIGFLLRKKGYVIHPVE